MSRARVVLDRSAISAFANGPVDGPVSADGAVSVGELLVMLLEEDDSVALIPATCLAVAHMQAVTPERRARIRLLRTLSQTRVVALDDDEELELATRLGAVHDLPLASAHAVAVARLRECYLLTHQGSLLRKHFGDDERWIIDIAA